MRLSDLLRKMEDATFVWISEDGDEGIYLGEVGSVPSGMSSFLCKF